MRLSYLVSALSLIMMYIGLVILSPIVVALIYGETSSIPPFVWASIISISLGIIVRRFVPNGLIPENLNDIKKAEALFIVAFTWVILGLLGAIPFLFYDLSPLNALFESVSGITATGATILTHFDYPHALFFWRSLTQWIGGLGIIVLFIAVLPQFAVAGRQMFFAEAPGPTEDKFTPRIRNTASSLWKVYVGLTVFEIVLLIFANMNPFDAICNSFSTIAAGGFSPNPESIQGYESNHITWIVLIFMFFAGASFNLQYKVLVQKNISLLFKNEEFRTYFFLVLFMTGIMAISLYYHNRLDWFQNFTNALFQVISISTSSGFASVDFEKWNYTPKLLLFIVMFMGSCASSAGGGIKMARWLIVFKAMKSEILKILHPNAIVNIKVDGKTVPPEVVRQIIVFVIFYFAIFGISAILMAIFEQNSAVGLTGAISSLGNVGPGVAVSTGPMGNYDSLHFMSKIIFIINMLVGRLELIPFLVLLQKDFWTLKD